MDVMMPRQDGIEACREFVEKLPSTQVLMLTASIEKGAVIEAVATGATGYPQKYSSGQELEEAIRALAEGRLRIADEAMRRTLAMIRGELREKDQSRFRSPCPCGSSSCCSADESPTPGSRRRRTFVR